MTPNTNKPNKKSAENILAKYLTERRYEEPIYFEADIILAMEEYATLKLHAKSEECERLTRELNLSNKEKDHWYKLFVKVAIYWYSKEIPNMDKEEFLQSKRFKSSM